MGRFWEKLLTDPLTYQHTDKGSFKGHFLSGSGGQDNLDWRTGNFVADMIFR